MRQNLFSCINMEPEWNKMSWSESSAEAFLPPAAAVSQHGLDLETWSPATRCLEHMHLLHLTNPLCFYQRVREKRNLPLEGVRPPESHLLGAYIPAWCSSSQLPVVDYGQLLNIQAPLNSPLKSGLTTVIQRCKPAPASSHQSWAVVFPTSGHILLPLLDEIRSAWHTGSAQRMGAGCISRCG